MENFNENGFEIIDIDGVPELDTELEDYQPSDDDIEKSLIDDLFEENDSLIDLGGGMIVPISELIDDEDFNDLYSDLDDWNSDILFDEVD